jgi:hypothetical protein
MANQSDLRNDYIRRVRLNYNSIWEPGKEDPVFPERNTEILNENINWTDASYPSVEGGGGTWSPTSNYIVTLVAIDSASGQLKIPSSSRYDIAVTWCGFANQEFKKGFKSSIYFAPISVLDFDFNPQQLGQAANPYGCYARIDFVKALQVLKARYGNKLSVSSLYRQPSHNANIGGAKNSLHMAGCAIDISANAEQREKLALLAWELGFGGIGMYDGWIHLDIAPISRWSDGKVPVFLNPDNRSVNNNRDSTQPKDE